jgi:hypothetical protein
MTGIWDVCPHCGAPQMPPVAPDSLATARACQACGWVEELRLVGGISEIHRLERRMAACERTQKATVDLVGGFLGLKPVPVSLPPRYVKGHAVV